MKNDVEAVQEDARKNVVNIAHLNTAVAAQNEHIINYLSFIFKCICFFQQFNKSFISIIIPILEILNIIWYYTFYTCIFQ